METELKPSKNQYIAGALVTGLGSVSIGMVIGFSAILLPQLDDNVIDSGRASWIASLSNLGQLVGAPIFGFLAGLTGRRMALILQCFPLTLGWLILGVSDSQFAFLCIGRILTGIGIMSTVTQMYLVEISDSRRRGTFGASGALAVSAGITSVYVSGSVLSWQWVCFVSGILPTVFAFTLIWYLPETPIWLASKGKRDDAQKVLRWLRGSQYNIEVEMEDLLETQVDVPSTDFCSTLTEFRQASAYKPLLLLVTLFAIQQWTGTYAIIFYAIQVFEDIGVANGYIPAIVVGLIRFMGCLLGTIALNKFPRKVLLIGSSLSMATILGLLSVTLYLKGNVISKGLEVWSAGLIIVYILVFGMGVGTVPWLLLGELCDVKVKGIISGLATSVCFGSVFVVVKIFPICISTFGIHGTYFLYAIFSLLLAVFTQFCLPETRGKSFQEIQQSFMD